jgi:DNA repair protein RecN (Recombination protein N)
MLNHLHIANFAIVPELNLDFSPGFTAITGETGAGKSIMVDALGLLLGDRADAAWVRGGAKRAELTAEFSLKNNTPARTWLDQADLSEDDECILRRTIGSNGRSRAFINGTPVTLAQIQALGQLLVEIHGQNEHLRLTHAKEQFKLLDGSGAYAKELDNLQKIFSAWKKVSEELEALEQDSAVSASDLEFLNFQLDELDQHQLSPASIETLQTEHDRLAAGDDLQAALTLAVESLEPESDASATGINDSINSTLNRLQRFAPLDAGIAEACQMLQEAAVDCAEALNTLQSARDRIDLDPAQFDQISDKLSALNELARKHRVRMDGLEAVRDALSDRIERAGSSEKRRTQLEAELKGTLADYRNAAEILHNKRKKHAAILSGQVLELMSELGMTGGSFEIAVNLRPQAVPSFRGDDDIQINISANPGTAPGPLNKIASGGELSRISLAIKVAAAGASDAITQIFDEVDAGIGGDTANAVGQLLKRLSLKGQALCVTHLAQVAVCAGQQLQVRKATEKSSTKVDTGLLDDTQRVDEIARMLSGRISDQSRAHAQELLLAAKAAA